MWDNPVSPNPLPIPVAFRQSCVLMSKTITIIVIIAAFSTGLYFGLSKRAQPLTLQNATYLEPARGIRPFEFESTSGSLLSKQALMQGWTLVFFGFTHCPDICPTTLQMLSNVRKAIAPSLPSDAVPDVLLITVDPERDTISALADYTAFFGDGVYGARASDELLEAFASDLGIVYKKIPLTGDDYTMDHSGAVLLIGPAANLRAVFTPPLSASALKNDIGQIIGSNLK